MLSILSHSHIYYRISHFDQVYLIHYDYILSINNTVHFIYFHAPHGLGYGNGCSGPTTRRHPPARAAAPCPHGLRPCHAPRPGRRRLRRHPQERPLRHWRPGSGPGRCAACGAHPRPAHLETGGRKLVDTLVSRGYLARAVDEQDRRRLVVTLTERGRAAAATQAGARERVDEALLGKVGLECVQQTRMALAALTEMAGWGEPGPAASEDDA